MIFRDCFELKQYIDRMVLMGLGHARPMLDRRGCDCGNGPVPLGDPGDGERVSADGSMVFLSARKGEE